MNFSGVLRLNKLGLILICTLLVFIVYIRLSWKSAEEPELVNLRKLLSVSIKAAEFGGEKVIDGKNKNLNVQSKGKTKEGANDLVTDADFASHCAMYNIMTRVFPTLAIISEEGNNEKSCPDEKTDEISLDNAFPNLLDEFVYPDDITIWIDPLDATQEYTEDLTDYVTTMVCVAVKGVPIIGVIHRPFTKKTSWGWFTKAVSTDLQSFQASPRGIEEPKIIVSRSHKGNVEDFAKEAFGQKAEVVAAGGAGYKILALGHYTADLYLHTTAIKKWDICAGNAIIKALNGKMTTLNNKSIDYSKDSDVKNNDGLLASVLNHDYYIKKTKILQKVLKT